MVASSHNSTLLGPAYDVLITNGSSLADFIRGLVQFQDITSATHEHVIFLTQDGPSRDREGDAGQYILEKLKLFDVHRALRGNNVSIAVIDSQIDATHPDFDGVVTSSYDATGAEERPHPHGTGMAGAIAAHQRLVGVAPSAHLLAIYAFSASAASPESTTFNILKVSITRSPIACGSLI
jgi:subtilisin family serine protease